MGKKKLEEVIGRRGLTAQQQKRLWARATACKRLLIEAGLATEGEFNRVEEAMLRDVETKVAAGIRKTVGADE